LAVWQNDTIFTTMSRRFTVVLFLLYIFSSCQKENPHPQWDINVVGPIVQATLGINDLIGDSSIQTNSDGAQILAYDSTFSQFDIDSIYKFNDTTFQTVTLVPVFLSRIPPNTPFSSANNNLSLNISGVLLKNAIISLGKIKLEIKNTLKTKVLFTYTIPKAKKNGSPFVVHTTVDSASKTDPKYFIGEYDLSGYSIDMTGATGNTFNTISYTINARSDPNGDTTNVLPLDTLLNFKTTLIGLKPSFVKGYLGQQESSQSNSSDFGVGTLVKNGTIALDSVKLNLDIINYIGADEQIYLNYLQSQNNRTGSTINLIAPGFIQSYININRASIAPWLADSLLPTIYSFQFDNTNSNIHDLIEILPDKFNYDLKLNLNPLGNVSGSNDFVFKDRLISTRLRLTMPLRFGLNQLLLADTAPFTISTATNFDPIGTTTLTLFAENGFPFDLNMQLYMIDSSHSIIDSMLVPDLIKSAPYNANYRATGITETQIKVPVDAERKQKILSAAYIGIRTTFNTPDYPQLIQMYSDYKLKLKIVADGIYSFR
jgi:hypothetical protein